MEPGFLPKLFGGLGNQIFIVVSAWVASKVHNCPLYLPKQELTKNPHSKEDYTRTVIRFFGTPLDMSEEEASKCLGYSKWSNLGFAHWSPSLLRPGQELSSYFQYYPPFAPFEDEIRATLLKGLPSIQEKPEAAFLHIRRGDYLKASHIHYIQTMEFYEKALDVMSKRGSFETLYIVSDDLVWAKQQVWPVSSYVRIEYVDKNEVETLALMSSCLAGAICGNSTFSWWGAFLGAYRLRNPVIVPSKWINEPIDCLFPPEWITID